MPKFFTKIPIALILFRLILGLITLVFSIISIPYFSTIAIILLCLGLLSDVFDGIIARKLKVSTQRLRRLDSTVDQIFYICFAYVSYRHCKSFFIHQKTEIILLLSFEALAYLISFIKFKKEIATHSIGAKFWTLLLVITLIEILSSCTSKVFVFCFWVGIITRIEVIVIILILKKWTNDVPNFLKAIELRRGNSIKRNKWFNG